MGGYIGWGGYMGGVDTWNGMDAGNGCREWSGYKMWRTQGWNGLEWVQWRQKLEWMQGV